MAVALAMEGFGIVDAVRAGGGVVEDIARRLAAGEALPSICRDPALPDMDVVSGWMAQGGAFEAALIRARAVRAQVLADEVLDIVEQVGLPGAPEDENGEGGAPPGSARRAPVADKEALALAKLRIDVRKWLIARTDEDAAPRGGAAEDRAALAAEVLRDLLIAIDGHGRGLPAASVTAAGRPAADVAVSGVPVGAVSPEDREHAQFRSGGQTACGAGAPVGAVPSEGGGQGEFGSDGQAASGAGPPETQFEGDGQSAGGVERPLMGSQPLPAGLFLRSRVRGGMERGADAGSSTGGVPPTGASDPSGGARAR